MTNLQRIMFHLQYILGYAAVIILAPLYFLCIRLMGYRVRDLRRIRKTCGDLLKSHGGPWIICANHLTMIDSMVLIYATMSLPGHLFHYRRVPWNLPERDNFQKNPLLTILCYLAKCIPINRGGDREELKKVFNKCAYLLGEGQSLLIFPEGGRSRTGRVDIDNFSYGVGRFISRFPECGVLCIYLRGDRQNTYSFIPRWGERFNVALEALNIEKNDLAGLRGQRFLAKQVIKKLAAMEEAYLARHRQRHSRSEESGGQRAEGGYALHQPRTHNN